VSFEFVHQYEAPVLAVVVGVFAVSSSGTLAPIPRTYLIGSVLALVDIVERDAFGTGC